jgi:predicted nucleotide-binding protein (sugar kinase/HSP70/actin superfamily)
VLGIWSTHQFWWGFLTAIGFEPELITFSGDTSEEQGRQFGKGRGTVDCCYPVKCVAGHFGELMFGQRKKIDILFAPLVFTLPSFLHGHVENSLTCPRVMAASENIRAGYLKENDVFAQHGIRYLAPFVSFAEPELLPAQLHAAFRDIFRGLTLEETRAAIAAGWRVQNAFDARMRARTRAVLADCARQELPCLMVLARPYHMDPGIGHEIEVELQAYGYPVIWAQHFPTDPDLMEWMFGDEVRAGAIKSPLDIADVWKSSYSANTNEIMWGAKAAARMPWIACVIRLSSYECGMDQPTYTPIQEIVEGSRTLYFSFQELDATKPAGSLKIRVETIVHYLRRYAAEIIARKKEAARPGCPLLSDNRPAAAESGASPG